MALLVPLLAGVGLTARPAGAAHTPHDQVVDLDVSPDFRDDGLLLALVEGQLRRSTDGGDTWDPVVGGVPGTGLLALTFAPTDADRVYLVADSTLHRSDDGGRSFAPVPGFPPGFGPVTPTVSRSDPDLVFVGNLAGEVVRSANGGTTWDPLEGLSGVVAIDFVGDTVFAATLDGRLRRSEDRGVTWDEGVSGLPAPIRSLEVVRSQSGWNVFVGGVDGALLRSRDGGRTFAPVGAGLAAETVRDVELVVDRIDGIVQVWAVTATTGPHVSTDGGDTFTPSAEGISGSDEAVAAGAPFTTAVHVAPLDEGAALFAAGYDGVFRSLDDGASWQALELLADTVTGVSLSPSFATDRTVVVTTQVKGAYVSRDAGATWELLTAGLRDTTGTNRAFPLRVLDGVAFSPDHERDATVFAASGNRLRVTRDGFGSWEPVVVAPGSADRPMRRFVLTPSPLYVFDQTLYVGTLGGDVFRSTQRGAEGTFELIGGFDREVSAVEVAVDGTILVAAGDGVHRSEDGGGSWVRIRQEADARLAASPTFADDGTLVVGTGAGLFVSRDRGDSFTRAEGLGPGDTVTVRAVAVSPTFGDDGLVLASADGVGLVRSVDGGGTFAPVASGLLLDGRFVADADDTAGRPLRFSPAFGEDQTVFATAGDTVLRSVDGGETWLDVSPPRAVDLAELEGVAGVDGREPPGRGPDFLGRGSGADGSSAPTDESADEEAGPEGPPPDDSDEPPWPIIGGVVAVVVVSLLVMIAGPPLRRRFY